MSDANSSAGKGMPRSNTQGVPPKPTKKMGELLIEAGLIERNQLEEALSMQQASGGKTVSNLIALGHLDASTFVRFLAKQPGVASIDLSNYEIPAEIISLIPKEMALRHELVPVDKMGSLLSVAMVCPLDRATLQELESLTGLRVKPILCSAKDVDEAIHRYYSRAEAAAAASKQEEAAWAASTASLESTMRLGAVAGLIHRISSLPVLPESVQRVREAMKNPEVSVDEVAGIITLDPALAAKVLGVANSAAYGFRSRVDNLVLAVSLLGLRETYSIVLAAAVLDLFEKSKVMDYKRFWLSSMCAAAAARLVAKAVGAREKAGVFAAGLLHDIGKAALAETIPQQYQRISSVLTGEALIAAEMEAMGISHAEAGYELAQHWGLPDDIAETIRFHHQPAMAQNAKQLVAIVAVADAMTRAQGKDYAQNEGIFEECKDAVAELRLDKENIEAMLAEFLEARESAISDAL